MECKENVLYMRLYHTDFVGTAILWNTSEEAWKDAEERVEAFIEGEENRIYYKKVSLMDMKLEISFHIKLYSVIRCLKRRSWSNEKRMDR